MPSISEKIETNLEKYYRNPSCILIILCILVLIVTSVMAFIDKQWSIGLLILIFLSIVLATLSIIALVATYREMSRLHNEEKKEFIVKVDGLLGKLEKIGRIDPKKVEENKKMLEDIKIIDDRLKQLEANPPAPDHVMGSRDIQNHINDFQTKLTEYVEKIHQEVQRQKIAKTIEKTSIKLSKKLSKLSKQQNSDAK